MRTPARLLVVIVFLSFTVPSTAQDSTDDLHREHARIYEKASPAVVFVSGSGQSASGFVIDSEGIVITSSTAVRSDTVTVQTPQHARYTAKVLGKSAELELAVLKIPGEDHPFLELGDSDAIRVGDVVYTLGDSFSSIQVDDQVAISVGVLSGRYELTKRARRNAYIGPVLETSAAVNQNQEGGPLVDARGRVLGMITLNYDESRFSGVAVPVNRLKAEIERIRAGGERVPVVNESGDGWFGLSVKEEGDVLEVVRVAPEGPAAKSGIRVGDRLIRVGGKSLTREEQVRDLEAKAVPGSEVEVEIRREGRNRRIKMVVQKKKVY